MPGLACHCPATICQRDDGAELKSSANTAPVGHCSPNAGAASSEEPPAGFVPPPSGVPPLPFELEQAARGAIDAARAMFLHTFLFKIHLDEGTPRLVLNF